MPEANPPDPALPFAPFESNTTPQRVFVVRPLRRRYWLHLLLFLCTVFTTLVVGARLQYNFDRNLPAFQSDDDFFPIEWAVENPQELVHGVPFMFTLLGILLAHEMGHFVYAARNRVYATLPYFIPAPTLIGTMGAFIRIRSPIPSRAALFDIGIAGPIAGFVVAVPLLFFSLLISKPGNFNSDSLILFGNPIIFNLGFHVLHGLHLIQTNSLADLCLHPVAIAVWVGMFATALNLLPGGQLDGGHIVYALAPRAHKYASWITVLALVPWIWTRWYGWLLWALLLLATGLQHPMVPGNPPIDRKRRLLAVFALVMFVLTLVPQPFALQGKPTSLREVVAGKWQALHRR